MFNTVGLTAFHVTEYLLKFVMHIQGFLIILTFNLYSFVCGDH